MGAEANPWWQIDLGQPHEISTVRVNAVPQNVMGFPIQGASLDSGGQLSSSFPASGVLDDDGEPKDMLEDNPAETSRTYSGIYSNDAIGTGHGRSMLGSAQGWSAITQTAGEWMMINLGEPKCV